MIANVPSRQVCKTSSAQRFHFFASRNFIICGLLVSLIWAPTAQADESQATAPDNRGGFFEQNKVTEDFFGNKIEKPAPRKKVEFTPTRAAQAMGYGGHLKGGAGLISSITADPSVSSSAESTRGRLTTSIEVPSIVSGTPANSSLQLQSPQQWQAQVPGKSSSSPDSAQQPAEPAPPAHEAAYTGNVSQEGAKSGGTTEDESDELGYRIQRMKSGVEHLSPDSAGSGAPTQEYLNRVIEQVEQAVDGPQGVQQKKQQERSESFRF